MIVLTLLFVSKIGLQAGNNIRNVQFMLRLIMEVLRWRNVGLR